MCLLLCMEQWSLVSTLLLNPIVLFLMSFAWLHALFILFLSLDNMVLLGNHYDAWTFGAVDPNSGTAVILEIARAIDQLRSSGKQ